jgi:hypothetical protein
MILSTCGCSVQHLIVNGRERRSHRTRHALHHEFQRNSVWPRLASRAPRQLPQRKTAVFETPASSGLVSGLFDYR